ncbi:hypothetical protein FH972_015467 [Carpinus fangiana]|uniref:Uncharacterized protein n=1 Tax=Carpinus fangiana TaxID=176857 RepID=A0A5N6RCY0_9ROSI|nr:hypothetical protein FH972_015467 [Carpinus fangiana]
MVKNEAQAQALLLMKTEPEVARRHWLAKLDAISLFLPDKNSCVESFSRVCGDTRKENEITKEVCVGWWEPSLGLPKKALLRPPQLSPAARLFKAFILDGDNLIPKVALQAISSIENIGGMEGLEPSRRSPLPKERVDEIDHTNFKYSYTVIEGGAVGDKLEKICN